MRIFLAGVASLLLAACGPSSTQFLGASQFPNGPTGCQARCSADGLEMSGFVYSGEFATSCVCRPRQSAPASPAQLPAAPAPSAAPSSEGPSTRVLSVPGVPSVPARGDTAAIHAADLAARVRRQLMLERAR